MKRESLNEIRPNTEASGRDEILKQHMGLVHHTVERLCGQSVRSTGSFDDLVSAGMIGLVHAYDAFDDSRGVAFSTFAHPRVRGAILDELRRLDNVPRSVRRKNREVARARDVVRARSGGRSSDSDVAHEMGIDVATLRTWELDAQCSNIESLDAGTWKESVVTSKASDSWIAREESADLLIERAEQVDAVREALAKMPEQERLVLILYFYEDLKLKQIGEIVGVSESRVSQIRSAALARLRREMASVAA